MDRDMEGFKEFLDFILGGKEAPKGRPHDCKTCRADCPIRVEAYVVPKKEVKKVEKIVDDRRADAEFPPLKIIKTVYEGKKTTVYYLSHNGSYKEASTTCKDGDVYNKYRGKEVAILKGILNEIKSALKTF